MHNDFYRMIGSLQALSQYLLTRNTDGTALSPRSTALRDAKTAAKELSMISNELLKAAFDFEVAQNEFQKQWAQRESAVEKAIADVFTNRTGPSAMPVKVDNQGAAVLNEEYKGRFNMTRGGTGERAQDFIDLMRSRLARSSVDQRYRTALTSEIDKLQDSLDRLLPAVQTLQNVFTIQAAAFIVVDGKVRALLPGNSSDLTTPWGKQDEQLQDMLTFMLTSAGATGTGSPGGTSTPSWGSTGTSGSSSSSSGG